MRDFDFIHSAEDVSEVLGLVSSLGLIIRRDQPSRDPLPHIVEPAEIAELREGVFMAFMPDWIFGNLRYNLIESGYRKGLYSQMPSTNCANLSFYFREETNESDFIRLGDGFLSRDIDWYSPDEHAVYRAPSDVKRMFDKIRREIDTGKYVHVGGRHYTVLRGALGKLASGTYRPPFDFMDAEPVLGRPDRPR